MALKASWSMDGNPNQRLKKLLNPNTTTLTAFSLSKLKTITGLLLTNMSNNKTRQQKYRDARKEAGLVLYRRYVKPELIPALDECLKKLEGK